MAAFHEVCRDVPRTPQERPRSQGFRALGSMTARQYAAGAEDVGAAPRAATPRALTPRAATPRAAAATPRRGGIGAPPLPPRAATPRQSSRPLVQLPPSPVAASGPPRRNAWPGRDRVPTPYSGGDPGDTVRCTPRQAPQQQRTYTPEIEDAALETEGRGPVPDLLEEKEPGAKRKLNDLVLLLGADPDKVAQGDFVGEFIKLKSRDNVSMLLGRVPKQYCPLAAKRRLEGPVPREIRGACESTTRAFHNVAATVGIAAWGENMQYGRKRDPANIYREVFLKQLHVLRKV